MTDLGLRVNHIYKKTLCQGTPTLFGNPFPHVFSANPILPHDMRRRYKPDMRDASSHGQTSAKKQQGLIFTEDKGQRIGA